jgi:TRAP-type C4-dicarboxylate transport system permease small subunit
MRYAVRKACSWVLCIALLGCAAWVSIMGYRQIMLTRSEKLNDLSTWLPKTEIVRLMRYHGADGLKITQDEVYIFRGEKWIPVWKRPRG